MIANVSLLWNLWFIESLPFYNCCSLGAFTKSNDMYEGIGESQIAVTTNGLKNHLARRASVAPPQLLFDAISTIVTGFALPEL